MKTVIFDFDGTLADSIDLMFRLYNAHSKQFGYLKIKRSEFSALRKMGYRKAMKNKKVKFYRVPQIIHTLSEEMRQHIDEVNPFEGIIKDLAKLKAEGFKIGVLTSNNQDIVEKYLKHHKFPEFEFVRSEMAIFGKDKALKHILKDYNLNKSDVVYVGDETRDVDASNKAGIKVIAVSWGLMGREGLENSTPDMIIDKTSELVGAVNTLIS